MSATKTKTYYVIQLQTGEMATEGGAFSPARTFESKREARKENWVAGIIGTFNAKNEFVPSDKDDFILLGRDMLLRLGAIPTPNGTRNFAIQTRFGTLRISMHAPSGGVAGRSGDFMCVFDNLKAAQDGGMFGGKSYSGKWNHHFDCTSEDAVARFENSLKSILPKSAREETLEGALRAIYNTLDGVDNSYAVAARKFASEALK